MAPLSKAPRGDSPISKSHTKIPAVIASRHFAAKQSRNPSEATDPTRVAKQPAIYIVASQRNGTLYVGVTSDLPKRAYQHRTGTHRGFAASHGCRLLVYFELHADMPTAIAREKQLKGGSRAKKLSLIESANPTWRDLYPEIL
jgi:putative endonuclease